MPLLSKKIEKSNILFTHNSYTLGTTAKSNISRFITRINKQELKKSGLKLKIKGYIDMSPLEKSTDSLAPKRAQSVYNYITSDLRFPKELLFVEKSRGKEYKILPVTKEGQRLNRRVEMKLSKQIRKKRKPTKQIKVEILSSNDCTINGQPVSTKTVRAGDTLKSGKNGNAVIIVNTGSQLSLQSGSAIIVGKKAIKLTKGVLLHELSDDKAIPVTLVTKDTKFRSEGLATIEIIDDTLRISQIEGSCTIKAKGHTKELSAMMGYYHLYDSYTMVPLPKPVTLKPMISHSQIPGLPILLQWKSDAFAYRVQIEDSVQTYIDSTISTESLPIKLPFGEYQYQIQSVDSLGFKSLWSILSTLSLSPQKGLLSNNQLSTKDTLLVNDRFLPLSFSVHPNCSISLDTILFSQDDTTQRTTYKLNKGLNRLNVVTHYPDSSFDTTEFYINYSGFDERFTLNDTIMNKPAFTSTRRFILKGSFPTATSLKINNETVPLKESGEFKHQLKFRSYKKHPIHLDVTYENGNNVRIQRTVERVKTKSEAEDALLKVLGLAVTGGILFLVGFGIE